MAIAYAGGTYDDRSVIVSASSTADLVPSITAGLTAAGWTVSNLSEWNWFGSTSSSAQPSDTQTCTINGRAYTFKTTLSGAADEIKIGASAKETMENFKAAINAEAGAGTKYGTGTTVNADVTAALVSTGDSANAVPLMVVYTKGTLSLAVSDTVTNWSWTNATLASVLYKCVSATNENYNRITMYIGARPGGVTTDYGAWISNKDQSQWTGRGQQTLSIANGETWRTLSHRYGFHSFKTGSYNGNGTGLSCELLYIPTFQRCNSVTAATNATPIAITTAADHGYSTGDSVIIRYVEGNTAANGTFTITVTGTNTFTLNASVGSGAFSGSLGIVANQTAPRTEVLELLTANFPTSATGGFNTSSTAYSANATPVHTIANGALYNNQTVNIALFNKPADTGNNKFAWVSGAGVAFEPLLIYTTLFGGAVRCPGYLYNAWWSSENTVGGTAVTADSHTWYGVWNNDSNGQLFILVS